MDSKERMLAFFGAMFVTFGINRLDFENPIFSENQSAYIILSLGVATLLFFFIKKIRTYF